MNKTTCHYWKAVIESDVVRDFLREYGSSMFTLAKDAENTGCNLVAFKIPKDANGKLNGQVIIEIERLLQQKFGIPKT